MTFSDSLRTCLRDKYVTFSGRASRSEFWWFMLFYWLVLIGVSLLVFGVFGTLGGPGNGGLGGGYLFLVLFGVVFVVLFLPLLSVTVRRLHDRDMSGWWYLLVLILSQVPYLGVLVSIGFLVLMAMKGTDGPNRFGPDPLKPGGADIFA